MAITARTIFLDGLLVLAAFTSTGLTACSGSDAAMDPEAALSLPVLSLPVLSLPVLSLPALDGSRHEPIPGEFDPLTVLLFVASDCPVANAYAPTISALRSEYAGRGVRFFLVNVEPDASVEALVEHADSYRLPRPILLDRDHALSARVGATVTPEAVVLGPGGALAYRGRIDDRFPELGIRRPEATRQELRDALDALLAGEAVATPEAAAVGCLIEDWSR